MEEKKMKKLFFVKTNGYNMIVSVDENNECRYLTETNDFPVLHADEDNKGAALEFLKIVDDDSSWEDDCTYSQIFEEFSDTTEIIAELESELL